MALPREPVVFARPNTGGAVVVLVMVKYAYWWCLLVLVVLVCVLCRYAPECNGVGELVWRYV